MKCCVRLPSFLILVALVCAAVTLSRLERVEDKDVKVEGEISSQNTHAVLDIQGFRYTERSQGAVDAEIFAERVVYYSRENHGRLDKLRISVFVKDEKVLTVDAESAEIYVRGKEVDVRGEIRVRTETGYELMTPSLTYFPRENKFTTPDKIQIKSPERTIEGLGMIVDINARQIKFGERGGGVEIFQDEELLGAVRKLTVICEDLLQDLLRDVATLKNRRREVSL